MIFKKYNDHKRIRAEKLIKASDKNVEDNLLLSTNHISSFLKKYAFPIVKKRLKHFNLNNEIKDSLRDLKKIRIIILFNNKQSFFV